MVSFDVVSLFTAIPVDKVCEYIRNKLTKDKPLHVRTKLSVENIIKLYVLLLLIAILITTI